jgi:predicted RecB family nuclease
MNITSYLFEAYLKCPTKCFLRSRGEAGAGNEYADWVRIQTEFYRNDRIKELKNIAARDGRIITAALTEGPMTERKYAFDFVARAANLESHIHFVERTPPKDPDKPAQFVPTQFIYTNKINRNDKLLLAFDARVLSEVVGHEVSLGKIIHGDDHTTLKVKTSALAKELRQLIGKITNLLSNNPPPEIVLNRHCAECEFKSRCRNKAIEANDLSLLSAMTEKERSRHRSKGIFTVNQLSYTFRPRKATKRAKNPAKPHYLALQALSLRENTVYVHGNPQLPMSDCKVFLDIEGLPDSEFYYLIGVLLVINGQECFHSFWAEEKSDEPNIFAQFVEIVSAFPDCRIYHFGNYETLALKRAKQKLPEHLRPKVDMILERSVNVLSVVHPHIYFPTYSNSLKEIGRFLGYARAEEDATGLQTIAWRKDWEASKEFGARNKLIQYNQDDCIQLKRLYEFLASLNSTDFRNNADDPTLPKLSRTEELKTDPARWEMFRAREYALEDFKHVVKCAYFDYQREKVFFRTHQHFKTINKHHRKLMRTNIRPNSIVILECHICPRCNSKRIEMIKRMSHAMIDLKFFKTGVKKWITRTDSSRYHCQKCKHDFSSEDRRPNPRRYGHSLMSWCAYFNAVCGANLSRTRRTLGDLFEIFLDKSKIYLLKRYLTDSYQTLYEEIFQATVRDPILHVDETVVHFRGGNTGYVWVLTSMDKVFYFYKPSRETAFLTEMLTPFSGVLVSDFYAGYDALECAQQKCLVHLVRDIDEDLLRNPLDSELKAIASELGSLLRGIIQSVDCYGLRSRHLGKHKRDVSRFLQSMVSKNFVSDLAVKYKKRFHKGGAKMFTFLDHDGVPWNNNNAEHAIKRFAKHRREGDGRFTERTLKEYLVLATVLETCEFNNVNVLKFLLSKETTLAGLFKMAKRKDQAILSKPGHLPLLQTKSTVEDLRSLLE